MELSLSGKVALITGANRGIGAAVAAELARENMNVCLVARDAGKLSEVAEQLRSDFGAGVHTIAADLREPGAAAQAVSETTGRFGRLDLLVNNAGATKRASFSDLTDDDWADGFALKFHGYVRMTRAAWPHLVQSSGSIVNIAGVGARAGSAEFTIGGSVNAALLNFTKAMADIGIEQNVRVNAVNPGLIATDRFNRNVERNMRERGLSRAEAIAFLIASHGTKRVGEPAEIGTLVAYLASDKAAFIQGCIIDIDGGANRAL
jgi:3-oxoacyl-[acyl-carrier protein] reductase